MKKLLLLLFLFFSVRILSQSTNYNGATPLPSAIVKDMMSWLYYERDYLNWSADYSTLDTSLKVISKIDFLKFLTTGKYLPLLIDTKDATLCYQLYPLDEAVDKGIVSTIQNIAQRQLKFFKMEGLPLIDFNYTDINGHTYNPETTKNKIIVLNCWFVHCKPCVAEIPDLNDLVKKYKKRDDIVFVALTFDSVEVINQFLNKNTFKYSIVANKEKYLTKDLNISGYPTQLIINRQGMIVKVIESNKIKELTDVLNKEIDK
jgi:peroxiredoxin